MVFCASPEESMIKSATELTETQKSVQEIAPVKTATTLISTKDASLVAKSPITSKRIYRSLMFTERNIEEVNKIIPKFMGNKNISVFDKLALEEEVNFTTNNIIDENNTFFYLNSIMYISKNSWALWINGNKITNVNNGEGEVSVTKISPISASFVWNIGPSRWNIINANDQFPKSKYKIEGEKINLFFTLSPNQTYLPASNKTIEGNVMSPKSIKVDEFQEDKVNKTKEDFSSMKEDFVF